MTERRPPSPPRSAREVAGKDKVDTECAPLMGAEDFAFMLQERPGAFIFVGNGDSAGCINPAYDFNDEAIPVGTSYWVRAGGDCARGLTPRLLRRFHAVLGGKLRRLSDDLRPWHESRRLSLDPAPELE